MALAKKHALRPLLQSRVEQDCVAVVPAAIRERLTQVMQRNAHTNLHLTRELLRVLAILRERDVHVIPYKGPVLAAMAHWDLTAREFFDLDILVPATQVPAAKGSLAAAGYHHSPALTPRQEAALLHSNCEYALENAEQEACVELHWRVAPSQFAVEFDVEELWARSRALMLAGVEVRTLSNEDLLLVLSVHAAKHLWERLGWHTDVVAIVRSEAGIDWRRVLEEAERLSALRILLITMHLCAELLALALPPEVIAAIDADPEVHAVADAVIADMYGELEETSSLRTHRLLLRTRPRWRDKTRYAMRVLFTPGVSEWALLSLPAPLAPLYPVIRMGRLAGKLFRGPARAGTAPLAPSPRARS
jgi:hypothetical protein